MALCPLAFQTPVGTPTAEKTALPMGCKSYTPARAAQHAPQGGVKSLELLQPETALFRTRRKKPPVAIYSNAPERPVQKWTR